MAMCQYLKQHHATRGSTFNVLNIRAECDRRIYACTSMAFDQK